MPSIQRVAFTIAGYPIYWYGIVIAVGVLAALVMSMAREKRVGVPKDTTLNVALLAIPVGLIFARLYYVAFTFDEYAGDLKQIFNIRQGGLAIWGGIIGGAVTVFFYARIRKVSFMRIADLLVPGLVLAQGIGRWGNFFNQEAYGMQILNPAHQFFPLAVYIEAQQGWYAATFFYESAWCILTSIALLWIERSGRQRKTGDLLLWYFVLYGFERSIVEGLRLDSLMYGSMRVSQILSLLLVLLGALIFYIRLFRGGGKAAIKIIGIILLLMGIAALIYPLYTHAALILLLSAVLIYRFIPKRKEALQ